jgi:Spy/CpxP family protein refolding chaperone
MTSMTMLKPTCGAFLLLALALSPKPAMAQDSETVAPPHHTSSRYKRRTLDDRVAVLSKNLELTGAQRSAVKKILEQRQQQTVRIRESEAPGNVRIEQFRALQERTVAQIRAVLTDEQKKKYDPLIPRTRPAPSTPQRSVEDWIKATTPH